MLHRLLLLAFLAILVLLFASAHAQELPNANVSLASACNHAGYEFWHGLKVLPVQFIGFSPEGAIWKYEDNDVTQIGLFTLSENTQYISQEKMPVGGLYILQRPGVLWLCYFCSRCHTLLFAYEMKPRAPSIDWSGPSAPAHQGLS